MKDQQEKPLTDTTDISDRGARFAILGTLLSLFAFSISVTTPWILKYASPPTPTIEEVAVDKAISIKERLVQAISGEEKKETAEEREPVKEVQHWTDHWSLIVILIALGGIVNGAFSYMRERHRYIGGMAMFFGISAILVQYWMITLGILIFLVFLAAILSSLGVEFY